MNAYHVFLALALSILSVACGPFGGTGGSGASSGGGGGGGAPVGCADAGDYCKACSGSNCVDGECAVIGDAMACCPTETLIDPVSGLPVGKNCGKRSCQDDGNPCTQEIPTADGCEHIPADHSTPCQVPGVGAGYCATSNLSIPLAVCCPGTSCLAIVAGSLKCVTDCPKGTTCDAQSGMCG